MAQAPNNFRVVIDLAHAEQEAARRMLESLKRSDVPNSPLRT